MRPRIFEVKRAAINIYLHKDQYDWLKQQRGKSPSAIVRELIDQQRAKEKTA